MWLEEQFLPPSDGLADHVLGVGLQRALAASRSSFEGARPWAVLRWRSVGEAFIEGPLSRARPGQLDRGQAVVSFYLSPWVASDLVGQLTETLVDQSIPFSVPVPSAEQLQQSHRGDPLLLAVRWIELWLTRKIGHVRGPRFPIMGDDLRERLALLGHCVTAWREHLGVSARVLQRQCVRQTGLAPQLLVRIFKAHHAVAMVRADPSLALSKIAHHVGYADGAHLSREIRRFIGTSLAQLRAQGCICNRSGPA